MVKFEDGVIRYDQGESDEDYPGDYYEDVQPSAAQRNEVVSNNIPERVRQSLVRHVELLMESVVRLQDPNIQIPLDEIAATGSAPLLLGGRQVAQAMLVSFAPARQTGNTELRLPPENLSLPSSEIYTSLGTEHGGDLHSWVNCLELRGAAGTTMIGDETTQGRAIRGEIQSRLTTVATMGYVDNRGELTNYGNGHGGDRSFYNPTPYRQHGLLVRAHRLDPRNSASDNIGYYRAFYAVPPATVRR